MASGQRRDSQVNISITQLDRCTPILRKTLFSDVHSTQYFDSGKYFFLNRFRYFETVKKHTVNSLSNNNSVFVGLDVYVGSTCFDGIKEQMVDELNDGGTPFCVEQILLAGQCVDVTQEGFLIHGVDYLLCLTRSVSVGQVDRFKNGFLG